MPTKTVTKTQREAWLNKATRKITRAWKKLGVTVPADVQLSCGFPGGGSPQRRIGECWPRSRSEKGVNQVFINPILDSAAQVLDVLGHELIHAVDDCQSKHGPNFTKLSGRVGYSGGKHSKVESDTAKALLVKLMQQLGAYPHGALDLTRRAKKENTGLHKFACVAGGEDILYSTSKNVERFGSPKCRCCGEDMAPAGRNDKKEIQTI